MFRLLTYFTVCFLVQIGHSQNGFEAFFKPSDSLNISRRNAVVITEASFSTVSLIGLNQLWYKDYPRSKFH
ncbi:MAG TPA: hypothetical protein VKZ97_04740, partial [Flavobacteriaceae bacterium]|nr:hypothetical protein [Flavobacteriaceae bacterium]